MLAIALVAAGYVGYTTWKRANLEVRLNEATVEVIRQDASIEKQNDMIERLQEDGSRQNQEANNRALKILRPQSKNEYEAGAKGMNAWLESYHEE